MRKQFPACKLISIVAAVSLALGLAPMPAFAADADGEAAAQPQAALDLSVGLTAQADSSAKFTLPTASDIEKAVAEAACMAAGVKYDETKTPAQNIAAAKAAGMENLKGHRSVGGMRASIYNAMPRAGVEKLVTFMEDFEKKHA